MPEVATLVRESVGRHGRERTGLLAVLQDVVRERRYLTEDALVEVARQMNLPAADVFGVASFYTFLDIKPRGRHIIRICQTIACDIKGKDEVARAIEEKLRIRVGETTPDGQFTLLKTNCIGLCHEGPAMLVDDKAYSGLTPENAVAILDQYL